MDNNQKNNCTPKYFSTSGVQLHYIQANHNLNSMIASFHHHYLV